MLEVVILISSLIGNLLLGFFSYQANRRSATNKIFGLLVLVTVFWLIVTYFSDNSSNPNTALSLVRVTMALAATQIYFIFLFVHTFPATTVQLGRRKYIVSIIYTILVIITALSPFMFTKLNGIKPTNPAPGPGIILFLIHVVIFFGGAIYLLLKKTIKAKGMLRQQLILLSLGIVVTFTLVALGNFVVLLIFKQAGLIFLTPVYTLILIGCIAYAIIYHGLFNIKTLLAELGTLIVATALFAKLFTSNSPNEIVVNVILLAMVIYGGYLLIKSVKEEIERRHEIQALAGRLDEANQHLEELDKMKDNFMSMASHELNTPIAAIEGYLSMILDEKIGLDGKEIPPTAKKYLDSVYVSSRRLAGLVKDLLNVSRIESKRIHVIYQEAQIEDIINQSVMEISPKVKEAGHTLTFEKPVAKTPKTWCDTARVTEVIINLLGNSIKYTDPGGKIIIGMKNDENFITIWVKDNGRGIPKEKQSHIFEKFGQVDILKDEVKGTGLGLFISKNLVELHKGKIWFESEGVPGKGTTFYFTLPILKHKPVDAHEGEGAVLQLK